MQIIIDARFLDIAQKYWGDRVIPSYVCKNIAEPVCAHPDMTLTRIGDVFVCSPDSYDYYSTFLGDKLLKGKKELSFHYPFDIAYNVLIYKNLAFAKEEHTDEVIKDELKKRNIKLINVNQGYSKCSAAVCNEGIITADKTIYRACMENGINALKITQGSVKLLGYEYGFIGGASGIVDGKLLFFGDIRKHPDYLKIKEFCDFEYIPDFPLTDVGTIMCI